jgi:hypothetical protein
MGSAEPPFEYLITSSQASLESFELSRLNAVANLRKELRQIVDEWIEAEIEARMARWILERRRLETAGRQPPAPALSESASPPNAAAQALSTETETRGRPKLGSRIAAEKPGSASAQRCLPNGGNKSRQMCSIRDTALPPGAAPAPSRHGSDPSRSPAPHEPESDPNTTAAVAALNLLEKAMRCGTRALQGEMEESESGRGPDSSATGEQLCLSGFSIPRNHFHDSTPGPPQCVLSVRPNPGNQRQLCLHTPRIQGHARPDQHDARRAPHSKSCPGQKPHPPVRPFSLYRHRLAAAP